MSEWKFVSCPKCHLNKFNVKTRREQDVRTFGFTASGGATPVTKKVQTIQIECGNCKTAVMSSTAEAP